LMGANAINLILNFNQRYTFIYKIFTQISCFCCFIV